MRFSILFFFYFFVSVTFSQGQLRTCYLGVSLFPSVEGFYNPTAVKSIHRDREKLSYNFGLRTKTYLSKKVSVNTGLMIYNKGRAYASPLAPQPGRYFNSVVLSTSIWYLSVPLNIQTHFSLPNKNTLSPTAGIIYGRRVLQYFHQTDPAHNFYYFSLDGSSDNHLGYTIGLSYILSAKKKIIELSPAYIRQINSGWRWPLNSPIKKRYDSYILELTVFGLITKEKIKTI